MEQHQIQLFHTHALEAAVDKPFHILGGISFSRMWIQASSAFCDHKEMVLMLRQEFADGNLTVGILA